MGARSFRELDCWQLANQLKLAVYQLVRTGEACRDISFREQMRNAAASAPRNIAEGFGRFVPRDFSQYLRIANGSLMETSNHLQDGLDRGYFRAADVEPLQILARRASAAVAALIRYLLTAPNPNSAIRPSRDPQNRRREPENRRTRAPKNQNPDT